MRPEGKENSRTVVRLDFEVLVEVTVLAAGVAEDACVFSAMPLSAMEGSRLCRRKGIRD